MITSSIISQNDRIAFKINDNLIANKKKLQLKYQVFLNENWHLFKYDLKKDIISTHDTFKKGLTDISVILTDSSGNQTCRDYQVEIK